MNNCEKATEDMFLSVSFRISGFTCITGTAEGQDEEKNWIEQALKAYDAQDYETSL